MRKGAMNQNFHLVRTTLDETLARLLAMPPRIKGLKRRRKTFIRDWREHRNLTQDQLADRLDTSKASLSRIENGHQPYTQDFLEACAHALQTDPASLLMRNPTDTESPWSLWETLKPTERKQATEVLRALKRAGEDAA